MVIVFAAIVLANACGRDRDQLAETPGATLPPAFYSSPAVSGTVVDRETRLPLEGAVVAAIWRKFDGVSGRWSGVFTSQETRSDAAGRFAIVAWGPRPAPPGAFLDKRDPELWVIHEGYIVGCFDNAGSADVLRPLDDHTASSWLKLPPNKMGAGRFMDYARDAAEDSRWDRRTLAIRKAANPSELARSLSAANPRDPYLPAEPRLPLYFETWRASRATLPSAVRATVPGKPRSLIDYTIRARS